MNVLSVDGIKKQFRHDMSLARHEVLRGISFHAREGEILGFLGPNGAGKTTTIKVILGLIRADAGTVTIFGRPVGDRGAMARVGYLPETPYFYPHLSLREFLGFCGVLSGLPRAGLEDHVARAAETVGLAREEGRRLKTFSKGMLQRAGLAQAILHDPDLLILDEPFSGLDPLGRKMVRDVLVDLKRRGKTIFFSSHILPDMEALCDRVSIIRDGVIVKSVDLDGLVRLGAGKVEIAATGWRPGMLAGIEECVSEKRETGNEVFLTVRERRFVRRVIEHLYAAGAEVLQVTGEGCSLEELFMREITGPTGPAGKAAKDEMPVFTGFKR
jgi:ABC-2 type transport system ATP-binding protein